MVRLYDVGRLRADEEDFEDVDDDDENAEGEDDGEGVALGDDDEEDEDDDLFPLDSSFDTDEEVQRTCLSLFALVFFFQTIFVDRIGAFASLSLKGGNLLFFFFAKHRTFLRVMCLHLLPIMLVGFCVVNAFVEKVSSMAQ